MLLGAKLNLLLYAVQKTDNYIISVNVVDIALAVWLSGLGHYTTAIVREPKDPCCASTHLPSYRRTTRYSSLPNWPAGRQCQGGTLSLLLSSEGELTGRQSTQRAH